LAELRDLPPHRIRRHLEYAITPSSESGQQPGTIRVDISEYFARWVELMECHQTQLRTRRYIELQTARARLLGLESGIEYAQVFYAPDAFLIKNLGELPPSVHLF
jgi:LmbE family N-acetylglucosaminyl deacetylase